MRLWLTGQMKSSIKNLRKTKMLKDKLKMVKQVNQYQVHAWNLVPGDFMPKIPTDEKIAANIRSLNKKQRTVFDVLHQWARNHVKNVSSKKNIFNLTQFMHFYLVVEAQGSLTWLKLFIKLYQKNHFITLKNQINHVFSFWVQ